MSQLMMGSPACWNDYSPGVLFIDGKSKPNAVHNDDVPADCTVKVSLEDFGKLMERKLDPMTAFMTGKIKIEGDMGVAMKLGKLFAP